MIARWKAARRKPEFDLIEDVIGVIALFAVLILALGLPSLV